MFWRPGCKSCTRLRGVLLDLEVDAVWRNIRADREAREFVGAANDDETVPVVRIGNHLLTDPSWRQLARLLGRATAGRLAHEGIAIALGLAAVAAWALSRP